MPLFRALFLAAAADCYLHGPGQQVEKAVAAGLCVIACLVNLSWGFALVELAWVAVFAKAYMDGEKLPSKTVDQITPVPVAAPSTSANAVPRAMKEAVDASMEQFLKNQKGPVTCDGLPWIEFKIVDGIKIERADYPGKSFKRWRCSADELYGTSEGIYKQLFDYAIRCPPTGWDDAIAWGKVVKEFDDGYRLLNYATASAAGGAVGSREFVECRLTKPLPEGGFYLSGTSVDDSMVQQIVPGFKGASGGPQGTRATSYPGGGARLEPMEGQPTDISVPRKHKFVLVTNVDLSGWLTQGLINSATTDALIDSTRATRDHLAKVAGKV